MMFVLSAGDSALLPHDIGAIGLVHCGMGCGERLRQIPDELGEVARQRRGPGDENIIMTLAT